MKIIAILKILVLVAVIQIVIILINLFRVKGLSFNKTILVGLFTFFGIFLLGYMFLFVHNKSLYTIGFLTNLFVFLSAPILFFYFQSLIENKLNFHKSDVLHVFPFFLVFLVMLYNLNYNTIKTFQYTDFGIVLISGLYIQNFVYLIAIFLKLRQKKKDFLKSKLKFVNDKMKLAVILLRSFSVILILQLGIFFTREILKMEVCIILTGMFFIFSFLMINSIILIGLSKSDLFEYKQKYKSSPIKENYKNEYLAIINNAILDEKLYMDPLITLDRLSKKIHIPKNYISQIINETFHQNFNELINEYRIKKAVELIDSSNGKLTIIDVAYSVGFNSKSTFYSAFKKSLKMTPNEYILLDTDSKMHSLAP